MEDGEVEEVDSDAEDEIDREDENKVSCGIPCICTSSPFVLTVVPHLDCRTFSSFSSWSGAVWGDNKIRDVKNPVLTMASTISNHLS